MSYFYLATPYARYREGHNAAFEEACKQAAILMQAGLPVFSPIAHSHPISLHGEFENTEHEFWMNVDRPFMDAAHGIIVCMMDGWQASRGVKYEIQTFERAGKPVHWMAPGHVPYSLIKRAA